MNLLFLLVNQFGRLAGLGEQLFFGLQLLLDKPMLGMGGLSIAIGAFVMWRMTQFEI